MRKSRMVALVLLLAATGTVPPRALRADEASGARSVDAVAKERADEFEELQKKKTTQAANQRLELLRGLAFAPCVTARRFLLALLKKPTTTGDERAEALRTLLHVAEEDDLPTMLATLAQAKDPTLWQVFGDGLAGGRSPGLRAWVKGPALVARDPDALGAYLDAPLPRDAAALEKIEGLYAKPQKPGGPDTNARALRALVSARGAGERPRLLEAARHADVRVRLVVADVLPGLEPFDAELEAGVRGLLQDESTAVRQTAAARAGAAKRTGLAAALITLLTDPRLRTRHVAALALQHATGQALGHDPKAWAAWFSKQDPGKPETVTFPTYHGFSVETDRVVFLVDASSSMTWPWRKSPKRIDVARAELASVLKQLTPETQFNVMVYADERAWFRKTPVPATPENVAGAAAWAEKALADPKGDTRLFEALEAAYANDPQFDTIFLLTDGNPTNGRYWATANLVASVRAWNRHRRAAIHAIGLSLANEDRSMPNLAEDLQVMAAVLSGVAGATAGQYREILNAPAAK